MYAAGCAIPVQIEAREAAQGGHLSLDQSELPVQLYHEQTGLGQRVPCPPLRNAMTHSVVGMHTLN